MKANQRLTLSAVLAAVVFGIGYFIAVVIPGAGSASASDYTKFYTSDSKQTVAAILYVALFVGCMAMLWFFNELRARLVEDTLTRLAFTATVVGVVAVLAGAAVLGGPAASVQGTDAAYVGNATASAFAQGGLALFLLGGMYSLGFAALLLTIALARQALLPKPAWIVAGILAIATFGSFFWIPGFAFLAWVLLTGIVVGTREGAPAAAAVAASRTPTPVT
jgi:hypothetical protein